MEQSLSSGAAVGGAGCAANGFFFRMLYAADYAAAG